MTERAVGPALDAGLMNLTQEEMDLLGLTGLDRGDRTIPRVRLIQPMTEAPEGARPGEFLNSVTGTATAALTFTVLRVAKGRVMWEKEFARDRDPLCASDDAIRPREGGSMPGPCEGCPMSAWDEDNGIPPACSLTYSYLCVDLETSLPFMVSLSRTSAGAARQLNTLFSARPLRRAYRATSEKIKNDKGQWYEWRLADDGALEQPIQYLQMARALADKSLTVDTGDPAQAEPGPGEGEQGDIPF